MTNPSAREIARKIAEYVYIIDGEVSEGMARTLIDKIESALKAYGNQKVEECAAKVEEMQRSYDEVPFAKVLIAEAIRKMKGE